MVVGNQIKQISLSRGGNVTSDGMRCGGGGGGGCGGRGGGVSISAHPSFYDSIVIHYIWEVILILISINNIRKF